MGTQTKQEMLEEYIMGKVRGDQLSIVNLKDGEVVEAFDEGLRLVMANIHDINTTLAPREIVLKIKITPSADRGLVTTKVDVTPKIAGMASIEGTADMAIDASGRGPYARRRISRQVELFGNVEHLTRGEGTNDRS